MRPQRMAIPRTLQSLHWSQERKPAETRTSISTNKEHHSSISSLHKSLSSNYYAQEAIEEGGVRGEKDGVQAPLSPVTSTNLTATRFYEGSTGKQHAVLLAHKKRTSWDNNDMK